MMEENMLEQAINAQEIYKENKKNIIENDLSIEREVKKVKYSYFFTKQLLKLITLLNGEKIVIMNKDKEVFPENRPIIFANTHRFKPDFEKITISTSIPSSIVASDFINPYKKISGWYFNTRSAIFVDPNSKEDKKYSYELMKKYLKNNINCSIFPEAVWNLSSNRIILDTFFGTVKAAIETNSIVVCNAIERYDKTYYINRSKYIDFSEISKKYVSKSFNELDENNIEEKKIKQTIIIECNNILRDTLATLLFEIWEKYANENGLCKRKEISDNYWNEFVKSLTNEWPGYDMQDNIKQQYQNQQFIIQNQVQDDISKIIPKKNNIFLYQSQEKFIQNIKIKRK